MTTIVFDDRGRAWDVNSCEFRSAFDGRKLDLNFIKYLVDELGFVALTQLESHRAARLQLRPAIAAPAGVAAALYVLLDKRPDRIVISHPRDGCSDELFVKISRAVDRVADLVSVAPDAREAPAFLRQHCPLRALLAETTPLSSLFQHWADAGRRPDYAAAPNRLEEMAKGRFMVVEPRDERLVIAAMGNGFISYDMRWRATAAGRPVDDQPDHAYGRWAHDTFREALLHHQPSGYDVDAIIKRPHAGDEIRLRYRMIMLPIEARSFANAGVLGASVIDERIDLRAPRRAKAVSGRP